MPKIKVTNDQGLEQLPGSGMLVTPETTINGSVSMRRRTMAVTGAKTLTADDSGIVLFVSASSTAAIAIDLPTAAAAGAGWFADFIITNDNDTATNIDTQADSTLFFSYNADGGADGHGITVATERTIAFATNTTKNAKIEIVSDGSVYYAHGFSGTAAELTGSGDAP